jgi:hypothetical protein
MASVNRQEFYKYLKDSIRLGGLPMREKIAGEPMFQQVQAEPDFLAAVRPSSK